MEYDQKGTGGLFWNTLNERERRGIRKTQKRNDSNNEREEREGFL